MHGLVHIDPALWRYGVSKIMGPRGWPFGVTWRRRSRDHATPKSRLPYRWSTVTMHLSSTVMEIWPFEVLPGTEVGRKSVGQYYTDLIYSLLFATLGT